MGEWKIFSSFYTPSKIIETPELIYFISDGFLYSYDKEYDEYKEYNKINLLNDNNVIDIEYDKTNDVLVIAYENSNIDLLINDRIYNIPYIKNTVLNTSKTINDINFHQDDILLSTDYGITILNAKKKEIKETYNFGFPIASACIYNNIIYAAGEDNIYTGDLNNNLLDFSNWKPYSSKDPKTNENLKIKRFLSNEYGVLMLGTDYQLRKIDANGNLIYIGLWFTNIKKNLNGDFVFFTKDMCGFANEDFSVKELFYYNNYEFLNKEIKDIITHNNHICFLTHEGIYIYQKKEDNELSLLKNIDCTHHLALKIPYYLYFNNNKLYVNSPGQNEYNRTEQFMNGNISIYENNRWTTLYSYTMPKLFYQPKYDFCSLYNIVADPDDPDIIYVGTWLDGLYRIKNNEFDAHFGNENVPYISNVSNWASKIAALTFDKNKNLWMTHYSSNTGLLIMKRDGSWVNYNYPDLKSCMQLNKMIIPQKSKTKWILSTYKYENCFIFAFNDNGTIDNLSDDVTRKFTSFTDQDDKHIEIAQFFCIAEDKKGHIWVGTNQGPLVFTQPDNFNNANFKCTRIKIPRNDGTNDADLLLSDESVLSIAIDGGNRKWIGTKESGVYLISEDGTRTLHHFTTQNSPLPSNTILNIAINPETGEVYFGTENGLAAFRWDSGEAKEDYSDIYAFPNPVRPDFEGWITITGLKENSLVKITDVAGNQIYQDYSHGGQMLWDGRNRNGDRVKTGIYLVFVSNKEDKSRVVTKIMVVN
ncbi:MAG: hypothetical protein J1E02_05430 [Coprobacter sp.]|nr:hypothetical protein [Coprobacter sp.]